MLLVAGVAEAGARQAGRGEGDVAEVAEHADVVDGVEGAEGEQLLGLSHEGGVLKVADVALVEAGVEVRVPGGLEAEHAQVAADVAEDVVFVLREGGFRLRRVRRGDEVWEGAFGGDGGGGELGEDGVAEGLVGEFGGVRVALEDVVLKGGGVGGGRVGLAGHVAEEAGEVRGFGVDEGGGLVSLLHVCGCFVDG